MKDFFSLKVWAKHVCVHYTRQNTLHHPRGTQQLHVFLMVLPGSLV